MIYKRGRTTLEVSSPEPIKALLEANEALAKEFNKYADNPFFSVRYRPKIWAYRIESEGDQWYVDAHWASEVDTIPKETLEALLDEDFRIVETHLSLSRVSEGEMQDNYVGVGGCVAMGISLAGLVGIIIFLLTYFLG